MFKFIGGKNMQWLIGCQKGQKLDTFKWTSLFIHNFIYRNPKCCTFHFDEFDRK